MGNGRAKESQSQRLGKRWPEKDGDGTRSETALGKQRAPLAAGTKEGRLIQFIWLCSPAKVPCALLLLVGQWPAASAAFCQCANGGRRWGRHWHIGRLAQLGEAHWHRRTAKGEEEREMAQEDRRATASATVAHCQRRRAGGNELATDGTHTHTIGPGAQPAAQPARAMWHREKQKEEEKNGTNE
jgi:hypothetical protein